MRPVILRRLRDRLARIIFGRTDKQAYSGVHLAEREYVDRTLDHYTREADLIEMRLRTIAKVRAERES